MTQQELLEYNKRCAEFLGWKYSQNYELFYEIDNIWEEKTDGVWYKESDRIENPKDYELYYVKVNGFCLKDYNYLLKFHSDWNWIHEVVEKMKDTMNPKEHSDTTFSYLRREVQTYLGRSNKEEVVEAINAFLIWYNENSNKKD